jgi:GNAT superfamily N-acetyltransferase
MTTVTETERPEPRIAMIDDLQCRWGEGHRPTPEQPVDVIPLPGVPGVFVDPSPMLASKIALGAPDEAILQAYENGKRVALITWGVSYWWSDVHEPSDLFVIDAFRGRGIATALWREAQRHDPALEHSEVRTPDGDVWARKTGDRLPKYRFEDEQGRHEFFTEHPEAQEDADAPASENPDGQPIEPKKRHR